MSIPKISKSFYLLFASFLLVAVSVFVLTCGEPFNPANELPDTADGSTRLIVEIHDTPFKMDGRTVEKLNITVSRMVIIDADGNHITILEEDRSMDILAVSRDDPVLLSDVSIAPGTYKELRLVLKDDSTIQVDGEIFDIKIPSGQQSGLKLKGPFVIPAGKLFRLTIDFVAKESVIYNRGQGFILKPVLEISNTSAITGIFRGNIYLFDDLGAGETLLQLFSDNTARLRIEHYPDYTLFADYAYSSIRKELRFTNLSLHAPGLGRLAMREVMKRMPGDITLPVKQWSLDSVIAIDHGGVRCNLCRVDEFDFSEGVSFTEFRVNVDYPGGGRGGRYLITEIRFIDTGMPAITLTSEFSGSRTSETVRANNSFIQGSSTRIQITSYLFDRLEDLNTEIGLYASLPAVIMSGSYFSETTHNPWQSPDEFTLIRDAHFQEFTVSFPPRLNIQMHHDNFTDNNPVVTWNPYPGAHGYYVMVHVKEKNINPHNDTESGSGFIAIAYYKHTTETSVRIYSEKITFTPIHSTRFVEEPRIKPGDFIRVEVYALDGSGTLDTRAGTGALFMDSATIIR